MGSLFSRSILFFPQPSNHLTRGASADLGYVMRLGACKRLMCSISLSQFFARFFGVHFWLFFLVFRTSDASHTWCSRRTHYVVSIPPNTIRWKEKRRKSFRKKENFLEYSHVGPPTRNVCLFSFLAVVSCLFWHAISLKPSLERLGSVMGTRLNICLPDLLPGSSKVT